ncbi:protein FAR1-RELATED SEQUENCE 5 [Artemisia annua]|uniref:Protein FAR1-RELATED SEQUENCE 5 n=1 Tax=Artemisia annua TaxID=35608 RepID=A0A2U1NNA8_ARTAN|nr:protein FAR1-RELATED SEQUENCE 5 [Artemisia annua]
MEEENLPEIMVDADVEEDEAEILVDADLEEENIAVIQESEIVMVDDEVMNEVEILVDADVQEENIVVIQVKKPEKPNVKNPSKASTKGWSKEARRKSGREIALEETSKRKRKCGFCGEKTNKHTKMTCPLNPKYIAKLARIADAQKNGTDASEQATRNFAAEQVTNTS